MPPTWTDLLSRAGLIDDGLRTARGIVSVATDGHLCRSMTERHIDDFLTTNGIKHAVEPNYPFDTDLNRNAMRADWLVEDGTFVEAWGLPGEPMYAANMDRISGLAAQHDLRLVTVTANDLARLHEVFKPWLHRALP